MNSAPLKSRSRAVRGQHVPPPPSSTGTWPAPALALVVSPLLPPPQPALPPQTIGVTRVVFDPLQTALAIHMGGTGDRRDEIARLLLKNSRLQRMIGQHEYDLNLRNERDEIVQNTVLVFLDKYLHTVPGNVVALDRPENVYMLLWSVSRNVALGVKGSMLSHDHRYQPLIAPNHRDRRSLHSVEEELPLPDSALDSDMYQDDFRDKVESAIDRQRAEDKLGPRFAAMGSRFWADLTKQKLEPPPGAKPAGARVLIKEAKELLSIRDRLHLSNQKMALTVGIEHPLFCAYIYGRTKKIPERVMQQARDLIRKNGDANKQILARLGKRSMRRIVGDWLTGLGQRPDQPGYTALGKILNADWHTVRRWHENEFKPPLAKLQVLEEMLFNVIPRRRLLAAYCGTVKLPKQTKDERALVALKSRKVAAQAPARATKPAGRSDKPARATPVAVKRAVASRGVRKAAKTGDKAPTSKRVTPLRGRLKGKVTASLTSKRGSPKAQRKAVAVPKPKPKIKAKAAPKGKGKVTAKSKAATPARKVASKPRTAGVRRAVPGKPVATRQSVSKPRTTVVKKKAAAVKIVKRGKPATKKPKPATAIKRKAVPASKRKAR